MSDLVMQLLGLAALLAGMAWGFGKWIKPHRSAASMDQQALRLLLITTLMGGALAAPAWWLDVRSAFSWDLPPLASRMLASAGLAFAYLCYSVLQHPTTAMVRLFLITLSVYLTPLLLCIVLFHLDRFDFNAPITYAFFAVVLGLVWPCLLYLIFQPDLPSTKPLIPYASAPVGAKRWQTLLSLLMLIWGMLLMITDNGGSKLLWPWPGDLLSSRLISVMLLTIAAGAWYAKRSMATTRTMLATTMLYGSLVVIAGLWNLVLMKPVPWLYVSMFAGIVLSSYLAWRATRQSGQI